MSIGFALLGRWTQLHPEKVAPQGVFAGENTLGARIFRVQVTVVGSFAVFAGTCGALVVVFVNVIPGSVSHATAWAAGLVAVAAGVIAISHVRKEVKLRQPYKGKTPYGCWP